MGIWESEIEPTDDAFGFLSARSRIRGANRIKNGVKVVLMELFKNKFNFTGITVSHKFWRNKINHIESFNLTKNFNLKLYFHNIHIMNDF